MKKLIIIIGILAGITAHAHENKIALFELFKTEKQIALSIKVDLHDLGDILLNGESFDNCEHFENLNAYLEQHFAISVNNQVQNICLNDLTQDCSFLMINATVSGESTIVKRVEIWNTFFVSEIDGHSNIIQTKLTNKLRGFRMSEKRTKILIEYT